MDTNKELRSFQNYGWHKGFYNDADITKALCAIDVADFIEVPDDDEFPYSSAHELLRGSCHIFALGLEKVFGYTPYIIEGKNGRGFHSFCQVYNRRTWLYIDARGMTSSFDEFMDVAKEFVTDEYTIRPVAATDIDEWKKDDEYYDLALEFAVALIKKYSDYYTNHKVSR